MRESFKLLHPVCPWMGAVQSLMTWGPWLRGAPGQDRLGSVSSLLRKGREGMAGVSGLGGGLGEGLALDPGTAGVTHVGVEHEVRGAGMPGVSVVVLSQLPAQPATSRLQRPSLAWPQTFPLLHPRTGPHSGFQRPQVSCGPGLLVPSTSVCPPR